MKKILFITFILFAAMTSFAQDVLIMKNGDEIKTKIIEVNDTQVKYRLFDDLEGPIYIVNRADAFEIKYASGHESVLNEHKMVENIEANRPSLRRKGLAVRPEVGGTLIIYDNVGDAKYTYDFGLNVVYQFNVKFSMGAGASFNKTNDYGNFVPVYVNLRGYFKNRLSSPFYDIRFGYTIPVKDYKYDIVADNETSSYKISRIKGAYVRFGVGMDVYNFYLGLHVGICVRNQKVYSDEAEGAVKKSDFDINQILFGVNFGYNIQCSKKK